jgi:carboxylesterase type B
MSEQSNLVLERGVSMEPIVGTAQGKVRGRSRDGVAAFLGIPYAQAPFGANRFAPPRPVPAWDGVRDALAYGPTAPKPGYPPPFDVLLPDPKIPGTDCLNLNVWTPDPGGSGLPVMVWVHGGAFRNGSGAVAVYDGTHFARDGVVCVTLNYRLGMEGFGYLPGAPSNRGLLDQIAALRWVQENIAAFGGDPGKVTIFGESAGGMSVTTLMSLGLGEQGLFRRVISQSGAGHIGQAPEDALLVTAEIARRLGVEPTAEGFAALDPDVIIPVQAAVAAEITTLPDPARWGRTTAASAMAMMPIVDGELLTARPEAAIAAGAGAGLDLLIGYTREEFRLFLVPLGLDKLITTELAAAILSGMGIDSALLAGYQAARPDEAPGEVLCAVITDGFFRVPAHRVAERESQARTFMYEFGWPSPAYDLRACHALELGFVFDNLHRAEGHALSGPNPPQELATAMHRAWIGFAEHGDPGWPVFDRETRPVKVFDGAADAVEHDPRAAERLLWR